MTSSITPWKRSVMITLVCPPLDTYDIDTSATITAPMKISHPSKWCSTFPIVYRFTPT